MMWLRIYQQYYSLIDTSLLKTFEIMCKLLKSHKKLKTTFMILKAIQELWNHTNPNNGPSIMVHIIFLYWILFSLP